MALSEMQSSQQAYRHQMKSGLGTGSLLFWTGVSSVTQELFAFTTPCSPAILPP